MPITVRCASCGKALKAKDESAGKKVKCPGCGAVIPVPRPDEGIEEEGIQASRPKAPAMPPRTPPRRRHEQNDDDEDISSRKPLPPPGKRPLPIDDDEEDDDRPRKPARPQKESTGMKALQTVLGLVILGAVGFAVWWFFLRGSGAGGDWKEFVSTDGRFKVLLPGEPKAGSKVLNSPAGPMTQYLYTIEYPKLRIGYVVSYTDYRTLGGAGSGDMLEGELELLINSIPKDKFRSKKLTTPKLGPNMEARELTLVTSEGSYRTRAIMVKRRMFIMMLRSPNEDRFDEYAAKMYDSFTLMGEVPDPPKDEDRKDDSKKDDVDKDEGKKDDTRKDDIKKDSDKKDKEEKTKMASGPFRGHTARIEGIALSPKADRLATVSEDGTLRVWEFPSGKEITFVNLKDDFRTPNSVAFHPTEDRLVVGLGGPGEKIIYYDLAGKKETSRNNADGSAEYLAFTPDGKHLIMGLRSRAYRLDPNVAEPGKEIADGNPTLLSADGKSLFVNHAQEVWIVDVETKKTNKSPPGWPKFKRGTRSFALSGDGNLLAIGATGGGVWFFDAVKQEPLPGRELKDTLEPMAMALSHKGDHLAVRDNNWRVYSLPGGKAVAAGPEDVRHLLFTPDGNLVMTLGPNVLIREGPTFQEKK